MKDVSRQISRALIASLMLKPGEKLPLDKKGRTGVALSARGSGDFQRTSTVPVRGYKHQEEARKVLREKAQREWEAEQRALARAREKRNKEKRDFLASDAEELEYLRSNRNAGGSF